MKSMIAGVDEVGRGSLIGPVYAAAVIFNKNIRKIINMYGWTDKLSNAWSNIQLYTNIG